MRIFKFWNDNSDKGGYIIKRSMIV